MGSAQIAAGAVGTAQLALGAVAASLGSAGQSAVASGGMVLSAEYNNGNLPNAGYVKLGRVELGDVWEERAGGGAPPVARRFHTAVWTGSEMTIWGGHNGSYTAQGHKLRFLAPREGREGTKEPQRKQGNKGWQETSLEDYHLCPCIV